MMEKENIKATGSVILKVVDAKTGKILKEDESHNLVVNLGKTNIAKMLGGDTAGKAITKIGVGEGSANPAVGNTNLTNRFLKSIDIVGYPKFNQVQFTFTLGPNDANGLNIKELGLFTSDNKLFSRKTRTAIAKTSSVIITGLWTITIN